MEQVNKFPYLNGEKSNLFSLFEEGVLLVTAALVVPKQPAFSRSGGLAHGG